MREKTEGVVEVPDIDRTSMQVFLRLIYTGQVGAYILLWSTMLPTFESRKRQRLTEKLSDELDEVSMAPTQPANAATWSSS